MDSSLLQNNTDISRKELQAAISKAVELRALHAALLQGTSPANPRLQGCPSPSGSLCANQFSAQDYPVFTPNYEDETLPGYNQVLTNNRRVSQNWDYVGLEDELEDIEAELSDAKKENQCNRKGRSSGFFNREHICSVEDYKFTPGSSVNQITVLQTSPGTDAFKSSQRTGSGDFRTVTTCNRCRPATISRENEDNSKNNRSKNTVVPADSHSTLQTPLRNKGPIFSWLFPRLKKKHRREGSPEKPEPDDGWGMLSLESLKKELIEANGHRDAAVMELAEMKFSLVDLKQKLVHLEDYCEDLKKALKQTVQGKETQVLERPNGTRRGKSLEISRDNSMPVSYEVMVEGFLQVVSETRLSVKQFCKTLVTQIEESDDSLMEKLNLLLQPYNLNLNSKFSKGVMYHLEALINQSLHQDFENCIFQKNGSPTDLDPLLDRQAKFAAFVALRNLSWNEVLRKGTKYYSEEFSRFCDQKMSCIISVLNWSRPWPEQLLQSFFIAAKCIWLLHLLAFSFSPPLPILRVEENRSFDPLYMEDILSERQRLQAPTRVRIMVMPGFYVRDKVLRCKVLCRYKNVA